MSKLMEFRRLLNDSKWGQKINGTDLGLRVEGMSRSISHTMRQAHYARLNDQAAQIGAYDPIKGAMFRQAIAGYVLQHELEAASPANAYSHTSPLYRPMVLDVGGTPIEYMAPVKVSHLLAARRMEREARREAGREEKLMRTLGMNAAPVAYAR